QVLDLGTGSGILGLACALMGARVTARDVAEIAAEVATANVKVNGMTDRMEVARGSIDTVAGQSFDLILANIIAAVLIDLAPQLAAALAPGGTLLASGIIEERAESVRSAFRATGLDLSAEINDGDWWLMAARHAG